MQAITVKFLPVTNFRGYRLKARCAAGSITIDRPSDGDFNAHARTAAVALCKKLEWDDAEALVEGTDYRGESVFVFPRG